MIETPRAALLADQIAEVADFFSFGTNDLTQMTFGFSRDDVEGRMMSAYLSQGLLSANPFENVDTAGVGELVRMAVERGPCRPSGPQDRRLRRARWRPVLDRLLRQGGTRLRQLLAVPGAGCAARGSPRGARHGRREGEASFGIARSRLRSNRTAGVPGTHRAARREYRPSDGDPRRGRDCGPLGDRHPRPDR